MSGQTQLEQCGNLFEVISNHAQGLCALDDAMKAIDVLRIEDQEVFLSSIGRLAITIGHVILEVTDQGRLLAKK